MEECPLGEGCHAGAEEEEEEQQSLLLYFLFPILLRRAVTEQLRWARGVKPPQEVNL